MEQWEKIADLFLEKKHFAFFDCAYQGFASGDLDRDASAVRYFEQRGVPMLVCQSFAKNAGLYGERVGALHIIGVDKPATDRIRSQVSVLQRSEISNPPSHGARIMALILNDGALFAQWQEDVKTMAHRIIDMREKLYNELTNVLHTPGNWDHILRQIGMFRFVSFANAFCSRLRVRGYYSFTGLNAEQSKAMVERAHIYLTNNGRISMAGLNSKNLRYVAESIDKAVKGEL
ncbi:Aspartate aminotransferase, cytoplasmic [Serendipita sp. 401]|nr:Aspartate aminotransferase, cytoplasmic [Serendipita sp. 401]